jgi:hypothetical protein
MENNNPNIQFTDSNQQVQSTKNGAKSLQRILLVVLLVLAVFLVIPDNPAFVFLNFAIPAVLTLLLAVTFFSSKSYKAVRATGNAFKIIVHVIVSVILLIITAVVSWVVVVFVGLSNGSYQMSTYGTPIHRPKVK